MTQLAGLITSFGPQHSRMHPYAEESKVNVERRAVAPPPRGAVIAPPHPPTLLLPDARKCAAPRRPGVAIKIALHTDSPSHLALRIMAASSYRASVTGGLSGRFALTVIAPVL